MNLKQAIKNVAEVPNKFNIAGGNINGDINFPSDNKIQWSQNKDSASISFKNDPNNIDSYMHFLVGNTGEKHFRFSTIDENSSTVLLTIKQDHLRFKGQPVYHTGNKPTPADIGAASSSHTHNYAASSSAGGSATSAVKLATARTINGTSFDGSANITTANWGTARTLTIGSTAKSVNGSANVSWTVAEIGAIPASASCNKNWSWSGQSGQPNWVWGGNDGVNMYVYNPSNFKVNYATSAGNSSKVGGKTIFVQQSQPTATATGDIWISW